MSPGVTRTVTSESAPVPIDMSILCGGAAIDLNRRGEVIHDSSAETFRVNAKRGTAPNGQAGVSA